MWQSALLLLSYRIRPLKVKRGKNRIHPLLCRCWVVQRVVQATTFLAADGTANDQLSNGGQITQLDQVRSDAIITVVLGNFLQQ